MQAWADYKTSQNRGNNAFICEIAFLTCNVIGSVYQQLNEFHRAMVRENREYFKVLIDVVLFLSKQELAFRGYRENEEVTKLS